MQVWCRRNRQPVFDVANEVNTIPIPVTRENFVTSYATAVGNSPPTVEAAEPPTSKPAQITNYSHTLSSPLMERQLQSP